MRAALTLKDINAPCARKQSCRLTLAPTMIKICSNKNRAVAAALVAAFVSFSVVRTTRANDIARQVAPIARRIQDRNGEGPHIR